MKRVKMIFLKDITAEELMNCQYESIFQYNTNLEITILSAAAMYHHKNSEKDIMRQYLEGYYRCKVLNEELYTKK